MGKVLSQSFETMGSNLAAFLILSLVFSGTPTFLIAWWTSGFATATDPEAMLAMFSSSAFWVRLAGAMAIGIVTQSLLQVAITRGTANSLSGRTSSFGELLEAALALVLPVVAVSVGPEREQLVF